MEAARNPEQKTVFKPFPIRSLVLNTIEKTHGDRLSSEQMHSITSLIASRVIIQYPNARKMNSGTQLDDVELHATVQDIQDIAAKYYPVSSVGNYIRPLPLEQMPEVEKPFAKRSRDGSLFLRRKKEQLLQTELDPQYERQARNIHEGVWYRLKKFGQVTTFVPV